MTSPPEVGRGSLFDPRSDITLEHYIDAKAVEQTGWRRPEISQALLTGEWRRCSKSIQKRDSSPHLQSGKHEFNIPQDGNPGFPAGFGERRQGIELQRGFDQIHCATARFAGRGNISA
jgi:hypothetical protein